MDKELNEQELENALGGANERAVDAKLQEGYTKTFRDKVLEAKLGNKDSDDVFNHRMTFEELEKYLNQESETDEKGHQR